MALSATAGSMTPMATTLARSWVIESSTGALTAQRSRALQCRPTGLGSLGRIALALQLGGTSPPSPTETRSRPRTARYRNSSDARSDMHDATASDPALRLARWVGIWSRIMRFAAHRREGGVLTPPPRFAGDAATKSVDASESTCRLAGSCSDASRSVSSRQQMCKIFLERHCAQLRSDWCCRLVTRIDRQAQDRDHRSR